MQRHGNSVQSLYADVHNFELPSEAERLDLIMRMQTQLNVSDARVIDMLRACEYPRADVDLKDVGRPP